MNQHSTHLDVGVDEIRHRGQMFRNVGIFLVFNRYPMVLEVGRKLFNAKVRSDTHDGHDTILFQNSRIGSRVNVSNEQTLQHFDWFHPNERSDREDGCPEWEEVKCRTKYRIEYRNGSSFHHRT